MSEPSKKTTFSNREKSPHYGDMQGVVDALFGENGRAYGPDGKLLRVRRLDAVLMVESLDLPTDLQEIINLLPPGNYTRQRLCDQINSAINGHAWGQVYGTVE